MRDVPAWDSLPKRRGRQPMQIKFVGLSSDADIADRWKPTAPDRGKKALRYRIAITSPLRSAATINPTWRPDTVSNAPFWLVSRIAPPPGPTAAPAPAAT